MVDCLKGVLKTKQAQGLSFVVVSSPLFHLRGREKECVDIVQQFMSKHLCHIQYRIVSFSPNS
jgi:hypothetical protein